MLSNMGFPLLMQAVPSEHAHQRDLWKKAWDTWATIGKKLVVFRTLSPEQVREALQEESQETMTALCENVPSQTLLVSYMEVLIQVRVKGHVGVKGQVEGQRTDRSQSARGL